MAIGEMVDQIENKKAQIRPAVSDFRPCRTTRRGESPGIQVWNFSVL